MTVFLLIRRSVGTGHLQSDGEIQLAEHLPYQREFFLGRWGAASEIKMGAGGS